MSKVQTNFTVDPNWQILIKDLGISPQDLLRYAGLPLDLFNRNLISISAEEYYRLFEGVGHFLDDPAFPLLLGQAISVEAFSPPIFACFCSENLNVALNRLSQYKPLICPMRLHVEQVEKQTMLTIGGIAEIVSPPSYVIAAELVFLVQLARLATRERIVPEAVHITTSLTEKDQYESYFGCSVVQGKFDGIIFSAEDAQRPFLSANDAMWSIFEPSLKTRMADLTVEATFDERVRACLMEVLASGKCSMQDISMKLGVSTRTLQRRLYAENTSFQQILNLLREELARYYLANSSYSSTEIAFLLGYDDPNSFFRAFQAWTGQSPEQVRTDRKTGSF